MSIQYYRADDIPVFYEKNIHRAQNETTRQLNNAAHCMMRDRPFVASARDYNDITNRPVFPVSDMGDLIIYHY